LRAQVESYGLKLEALENTPNRFFESAMLGLPDRDQAIEGYQETIRNVGKAGIPILGFHWMPNSVWRTSRLGPGRNKKSRVPRRGTTIQGFVVFFACGCVGSNVPLRTLFAAALRKPCCSDFQRSTFRSVRSFNIDHGVWPRMLLSWLRNCCC